MKRTFTFLLTVIVAFLVLPADAQVVFIPDANFKQALVANASINTNGDSEIQVSEATGYRGTVDVSGRAIEDLSGIEAFVNIPRLYATNNNLTWIDVSDNAALQALRVNHNQLTSVDVSENQNLTDLRVYQNNLQSIDLSANTGLTMLLIFNNALTSLDLSNNIALTRLEAGYNNFTEIDLSANVNLTHVSVTGGATRTFNIKNGNNTNITFFDARSAFDLICITVDDPAYSEANWTNVERQTTFSTDCESVANDVVFIPDPNFKAFLVGHDYINVNGDDEIQRHEAEAWAGPIHVAGMNISDLTGIEAFINIRELHCQINNLTFLDVSKNTRVVEFFCDKNQLTSLDVSTMVELEILQCFRNQLTTLDVSHNPKLFEIWAYENQIQHMDVSQNPALLRLECDLNGMTTLTLGNNPVLYSLICDNNELETLDLSGTPKLRNLEAQVNRINNIDPTNCPELQRIRLGDNQLTTIDLSQNSMIRTLELYNNQLTTLDLRPNVQLEYMSAYLNRLTSANVKNGQNRRIRYFNTERNPDLDCIEVDDPNFSRINWLKDDHAVYSYDCSNPTQDPSIVFIPDQAFKAHLLGDPTINTNGDDEIQVTEAQARTGFLNLDAVGILDATGIEAFTSLEQINFEHNSLAYLDVRENTSLHTLECGQNVIQELWINPQLEVLFCYENSLTRLDLGFNNSLRVLDFNRNSVITFDADDYDFGATLETLNPDRNPLSVVDVRSLERLSWFYLELSNVSTLDFSNNPMLDYLVLQRNFNLTFLNVKNGHNTEISTLDATLNFNLECIEVDDVAYAQSHFSKPPQTRFSTNCEGSVAGTVASFAVSPNPTSGRIAVESSEPVDGIVILDGISGETITTGSGNEIDITGLPRGIYFVRVIQGGAVNTERIIKE